MSKTAWASASLSVAAMMLMSDTADVQTPSSGDDLPQVRVIAPK